MTTVVNLISTIAEIAGIVCFFIGYPYVTLFCAIISIISSIVQVMIGKQNSLLTEVIAIAIGLIVAGASSLSVVEGISLLLCIRGVFMLVGGWIFALVLYFVGTRSW